MKFYRIIFLVSLAMTSAAAAQNAKADRNTQFWNEWQELRETEKWKALEGSTNVMREADGPAGNAAAQGGAPKEAVRDRYIFNMSVDKPQEVAKFVAKVATNKIDGAEGALSTVVNMRTSPAARKASTAHVPAAERTNYAAFVERIPPRRYFSDPFAGTATTSAYAETPRPAAPTGYVPVKGASFGCRVR